VALQLATADADGECLPGGQRREGDKLVRLLRGREEVGLTVRVDGEVTGDRHLPGADGVIVACDVARSPALLSFGVQQIEALVSLGWVRLWVNDHRPAVRYVPLLFSPPLLRRTLCYRTTTGLSGLVGLVDSNPLPALACPTPIGVPAEASASREEDHRHQQDGKTAHNEIVTRPVPALKPLAPL
jgi:hypothetical protein